MIRWQAMRDLLDAPQAEWQAERARIPNEGWGREFLSHQAEDGSWPRARWTGTLWTLTFLVETGIPPGDERFLRGFELVVGGLLPKGEAATAEYLLKNMDQCHLGFWLRIGAYFCPADARLPLLAGTLLGAQMADGGWNCRTRTDPKARHSSFHTTFNVLEGIREAAGAGIIEETTFREAEARAIEFMLQHRLYRSDKTGNVVQHRFLELAYPSYWHYNVLRALDYIRSTPAITDERLDDPLSVLRGRRKPNGRWPVEKRISGVTLFDMEPMGKDSRWNTLRALRVLKAAGEPV